MQKLITLFAGALCVSATFAQPCTKLFFSEYIEGSSNNKAVEIFNPSNDSVNLSGYKIVNFHNGYTTATAAYSYVLSGIIAPHATFAVCRKTASDALKTRCQDSTTSSTLNFNGDDAIALLYQTDTIDVIGKIGQDPGSYWHLGIDSTKYETLVRKPEVNEGTTDSSISFHQWIGYPKDDFSHLGSHNFIACDSSIIDTTSPPDTTVIVVPTDSIPYYPIALITTENENGVADSLNVHC
ncbi:MAG TPA: lamin tail domain-containing protein, partial [Chitinophagales bacterium]